MKLKIVFTTEINFLLSKLSRMYLLKFYFFFELEEPSQQLVFKNI